LNSRFILIRTLCSERTRYAFSLCLLLVLTLFNSDTAPAQSSCGNLRNLVLSNTTITLAESLAAGPQAEPIGDLPVPICRVVAHITPSSDSDIEIEAWLPAAGWNGKFQGVGNGTFLGQIMYDNLRSGIARGYATVSTDTGHKSAGNDASWGLGHPEKVTDFMGRAVHEMTVKGKAIAQAFYGVGPRLSYWIGCSSGGRQGLKEAQVYADDYDGMTVGAPANNWSHQFGAHLYNAVTAFRNGPGPEYIPPAKFSLLANAALAACDGTDGIADGVITDPQSCSFDPAALQCLSGNAPACLSASQVQTARKIYAGAKFSNGQSFYPGLPPSSEIGWGATAGGPEPFDVPNTHFKHLVFGDPGWDWRTFNPDLDMPRANSVHAYGINATDPNLAAFKARGGKLIMWHGWLDAIIFARNSIDYYESVVATMGAAETDDFFRLFMAPGMQHCGGGPGPNILDPVTPLERWVEQGIAPNQIVAFNSTNGIVTRRRPLCPYPQTAAYKGSGDINAVESFVCRTPATVFDIPNRGSISRTSPGSSGSLTVGYAAIRPDTGSTSPSGLAIFALRQNNVLISEASVPASPLMQNGRIYAEINSPVNTGVAMANPAAQDATVTFFFTDQSGNFGNGSTVIPAGGQFAAFLDQAPFAGRPIVNGAFTFSSSVP
jgi:feruloyl esterase